VKVLPWLALSTALWPTAWFCVQRVQTTEDAACLLFSLATALLVSWRATPSTGNAFNHRAVTVAVLGYAAAQWWATPLFAAMAGMTALAIALSTRAFGKTLQPGVLLLLFLALPVIPTLEFALGHPLRVLATHGAHVLLGLMGQAVEPVGTCLRGDRGVVCVDAPCAGVRMVWTAAWCVGAVSSWNVLSWARTAGLGILALAAVLAGNMLRTASLFIAESRLVVPAWMHEGVGLAAFGLVVACVLGAGFNLKGGAPCATLPA
jgi:exosortase/archaeosortase family protein